MEIASNKGVIADASTPAGRAGMSESEWREAIKFDSTDTGWVIMSIGMAIGAGIVFLPVQVGLMGLWVFLLSSVIGYPAMYLFQRLFINTLAESPECKDYPSVISGYLGKNRGILLGALYFVMLVIWMFVYSTAITNDVGWTGIIVAWLSQLNTAVIFVVSALICVLHYGSTVAAATFSQVDSSFANMLQGVILFLILAADFLTRFRVVSVKKGGNGNGNG